MKVYAAIAKVAGDLAQTGIAKARKNEQQGFRFRGIDDVFNALAPSLVSHGLLILPRMMSRTVTERTTSKGGVLFYVLVEAEFDFVAVEDGSKHTIRTFGEAMDSGDKATNKAMSAAYKYAAFQAFCIPTEANEDADATTHEVVATAPAGFEDWRIDFEGCADNGSAALALAWKASREDYRKHYSATVSEARRTALRETAKAVDAKAEAVPA